MKRKVIILDAPNYIDLATAEAELAAGGYGTGDLLRVIRHYQEKGVSEAKRVYPDHLAFIGHLKGKKLQPMIDDIFNQINLLQYE